MPYRIVDLGYKKFTARGESVWFKNVCPLSQRVVRSMSYLTVCIHHVSTFLSRSITNNQFRTYPLSARVTVIHPQGPIHHHGYYFKQTMSKKCVVQSVPFGYWGAIGIHKCDARVTILVVVVVVVVGECQTLLHRTPS